MLEPLRLDVWPAKCRKSWFEIDVWEKRSSSKSSLGSVCTFKSIFWGDTSHYHSWHATECLSLCLTLSWSRAVLNTFACFKKFLIIFPLTCHTFPKQNCFMGDEECLHPRHPLRCFTGDSVPIGHGRRLRLAPSQAGSNPPWQCFWSMGPTKYLKFSEGSSSHLGWFEPIQTILMSIAIIILGTMRKKKHI